MPGCSGAPPATGAPRSDLRDLHRALQNPGGQPGTFPSTVAFLAAQLLGPIQEIGSAVFRTADDHAFEIRKIGTWQPKAPLKNHLQHLPAVAFEDRQELLFNGLRLDPHKPLHPAHRCAHYHQGEGLQE